MRKIIFLTLIAAFIILQAIPALAYDNKIEFYLYNYSDDMTVICKVKGIENFDGGGSMHAGPGGVSNYTSVEVPAWWLSATTYKFLISFYSMSGTTGELAAEYELTCQNMFILWPTFLQFYIGNSRVYQGDFEITYNLDSEACNATVTMWVR